ncbi:glycosyltransferase family 4 protein [bacterium]|nr:glycosyltransferase family 4 protein [bacterium]MBU1990595.1 glycosyltransferase family 4 protein [bacterium]
MLEYPIVDFLKDLKAEDKQLFAETLQYLHTSTHSNVGSFLIDLAVNDHNETLTKLFEFMVTKEEYVETLPEVCIRDLHEKNNFGLITEAVLSDELPLSQRNTLYWLAMQLSARYNDREFLNQKECYLSLLNSAKELLDLSVLKDLEINVDEKRVFLYINQYIKEPHAPTTIANSWANVFKYLGYKVIIISCAPSKFAFPSLVSYAYHKLLSLGESKEIDKGIFLIEIGSNLVVNDIYVKLIEAVHMNKNDKFLLIGDSCLPFDILPFEHKYVVPTIAAKTFLTTTAKSYILNKNLDLVNIYDENIHFVKGPNDYTKSDNENFNPQDIKDNDTINIALIGNRLKNELDDVFWEHIDTLITQRQNIKIHIIGVVPEEFIPQKLSSKIILAGFQTDLNAYLKNMQFYLNPDRQGGGQSAISAIKLGLPVITLPKHDVYHAIQEKYFIEDLSQINTFIDSYIHDAEFKTHIDNSNHMLNKQYNDSENELRQAVQTLLGI